MVKKAINIHLRIAQKTNRSAFLAPDKPGKGVIYFMLFLFLISQEK
jgi:hypothetical protein